MSILNFSDVDECSADTDNCTQNCENTDGSFTCSCNDGYTTTDNGITCDGIILPIFWNMFWSNNKSSKCNFTSNLLFKILICIWFFSMIR